MARRFVGALAYADDVSTRPFSQGSQYFSSPNLSLLVTKIFLFYFLSTWTNQWNMFNWNSEKESMRPCTSDSTRRCRYSYCRWSLSPGYKFRFDLDDPAEIYSMLANSTDNFISFTRSSTAFERENYWFPCTTRSVLFLWTWNTFSSRASQASIQFLRESVNLALMRLLQLPLESVSPHYLPMVL